MYVGMGASGIGLVKIRNWNCRDSINFPYTLHPNLLYLSKKTVFYPNCSLIFIIYPLLLPFFCSKIHWILSLNRLIFCMYLFLLGVHEQHSTCVEIRGQHVGLLTLLPICESLRLNSEHQEEWEYFYPLKHFTGPICNYLHLCH